MSNQSSLEHSGSIAIIGMAGRFPGAKDLDAFWRNLRDGVESVTHFSREELAASGVEPTLLSNPKYIRANPILEGIEYFDAGFFGFSPREAALMDPQQRIFLECAWEALESAGYDPGSYSGNIGVYAGSSMSSYLLSNVLRSSEAKRWPYDLQALLGNDKDYLTSRVSYKLNLRGPSLGIQAACSTSLAAVHLACMSLLERECDMVLAGGITIRVPAKSGYLYEEGGIFSSDGHCRAFDAEANGTIYGSGVGIVVLKRLEDALADGDHIRAVILGSALNNDGALKAGFSAPGEDGQVNAITEALGLAGVEASSLQYVETHGTGTRLGDAIEAAALTRVWRASTSARRVCAIGSVKTNVGHLEAAAGIASLIKTVLALEHRQLPPSLHFKSPNPSIDLTNGPLYVNATLQEWKAGPLPRRAGVSSFAIGGSNAHVVLQEAPAANARSAAAQDSRPVLLPLSARSSEALRAMAEAYRALLAQGTAAPLQDMAYTASVRRSHHSNRLALIGASRDEFLQGLEAYLQGVPHPGVYQSAGQGAASGVRREQGERMAMLSSLGARYVQGQSVDWRQLYPSGGRCVPLPAYAWQRQRYWIEPDEAESSRRPRRAVEPQLVPGAVGGPGGATPLEALREAPPAERPRLLRRLILERTAHVLRMDPTQLDPEAPLTSFGMDSLLGMELREALQSGLRLPLPVSFIWKYPSVNALGEHLLELLNANLSSEAASLPEVERDSVERYIISRPEERSRPFALTELQQAYWLGQSGLFELGTDAVVFIEVDLFDPDIDRLRFAAQRVIERHEMLRSIVRPDGQHQILEQVPPLPFTLEDMRGREPGEVASHLESVRRRLGTEAKTGTWPQIQIHACRMEGRILKVLLGIPCLLVDARSVFLAARDLVRFYQAPDATLEPIDISYRDLVVGMLAARESGVYKASEEYWRDRLATLPPGPELPLARAPSSVRQSRFNHRTGTLPRELWERLKQHARKTGITPSSALCAIYAEVISKWSGKSHFTLNILYQDRPPIHPRVLEVFGNFSTTMLLEVDNRASVPFEERARRLQSRLWSDLEHVRVSGIQVVRELARARGGSAPAAMPVVFTSTLHVDIDAVDPQGGLGKLVTSSIVTPHVWIDHQVSEEAGALRFHWDVVEELFPEGLIDAMFEAYRRLLERLADESAWRETHFPLLPSEQATEHKFVNATAAPIPEELLHGRFAAQARARPSQVAIVGAGRRLTYDDVFRKANQVGRQLRELGARPNKLVAVVMEKGWEQVVATLGILHAGAAYLPIDPSLPTERIHYLLQNAEVELVLTQPWVDARLAWPPWVRRLRVDEETFAGVEDGPLSPVQGPDDLAYVIFTSGSTGLPKGVMISHRGAVNTIIDINQRFAVGPGDRVLALSSLSFDLSVYDIFGILAAGGTIIIPSASATKEPSSWATLMHQEQVTLWNSVPALMQLLVEHLAGRPELPRPPLRCVLMSGDWIPVALPERIRALFEGVQVISLGGATEASIWSIIYPIGKVEPGWQSIPYGRPMKNQTFHVLDEHLEPCPVWVMGELYIGGIGLAQGYWRDEEKTRSRFITHPRTGERLYRTGDLGRYLPVGDIEFMGRADFQVKIQGYRIELGEIETTLERHPAIQSAVVNAVGDRRGSKLLVGYVVYRPGVEPLETASLREFLRQKLPEYMVPSTFIQLDALPLSSNGKVDRAALPSPEQASARKERSFVAPRDEIELQLARLWEELLNVQPIGIKDSFFELGGHSFAAVRLTGMIQQTFQRSISLPTLMQGPTIEQIAEALRQSASAAWSPLVRLQPEGPRAPFFCVHAVGGSALAYRELALQLGQERPFYGLQARGVDTDEAPLMDIPEMARRYLEAMREVQPKGPYHLGGWSFGGLVAFEMASQLKAAGEEVATLVLLDSQAPAPAPSGEADDVETFFLFARDIGLPVSAEVLRPLMPDARIAHIREFAVDAGLLPANAEEPYLRRLLGIYAAHLGAVRRYTPRPYGGQINLVRAQHLLEELGAARHVGDQTWGWSSLASEPVRLHVVPGDHFTMVRAPHVRQLAETLRRVISGQG